MPSTVYVLTAISEGAKKWVEDHVNYEDWQMVGEGIAVDHRYIGDIVEGLIREGFRMGEDYQVTSE